MRIGLSFNKVMRDTRILLISPNKGLAINKPKRSKFQSHPLGLLYIAALLEKEGFTVGISDAFSFGYTLAEIKKYIVSFRPRIIGLTAMTILSPAAYLVAEEAKKIDPSIITVIGGPHATAMSHEVLDRKAIDIAVIGEGEYAMLEICNLVSNGRKDFDSVKGILYKDNGIITKTEVRPPLIDLDRLPFPAYHLLDNMARYNPPPHWGKKGKFASLITSRGCPYGCIFCYVTRAWGRRYRYRSTENVLAELELLSKRYGAGYISFRDSTMTLHKQRIIDICKGMIKNRLDIKWNCNARANEVDNEILEWMKRAGCESIQYGIECGNEEMLRKFKKLDKEEIAEAIKLTDSYNIKAHGYFILGLPGETKETIRETIDFAKSLPLYSAGFATATPFPGSELWDYSVENNLLITKDWLKYDLKNIPVSRYSNLQPQQVLRSQKKAFREFYLRPKILFYHMSRVKNLNDLLNYIVESLINLK